MTPGKVDEKAVQQWLAHASDDELNIRSILKHRDGTPAAVCFMTQQMAEKLYKALLLHQTGDYPKTHDLNQLIDLLKTTGVNIDAEREKANARLSVYYVTTRYPTHVPFESFTWEMAEEAYEEAQQVKEFVMKELEAK